MCCSTPVRDTAVRSSSNLSISSVLGIGPVKHPGATRHARITDRSSAFDNVNVAHAWSVGPRARAHITSVPVLVPGAIVPVALVAGFTVIPVVVVAAALVPVAAPTGIPPLAGAPVIIRERRGLGLGDGGRPQTREP